MLGKVHTWKSSRPSPPIVCLHGYLGSGSDFQILADSYRDHPTLIAPNFPDYGCSPSSEKTTWPKTIDALYTFLQDTLKSTPCILLGYSMGGRIALQFATKYPQLLKALVLVGATPGIKDEVKREERKRSDEALASTIMTRSVEAFIESWNQQPLIKTQERIPSPYQEVMMDVRNTHNKEALSHFLRFLGTGTMESAWETLNALHLSTLIVSGEEDIKFSKLAQQMGRSIPQSTVCEIREAGHACCFEQPRQFAQELDHFVQTISE